MFDKGQRAQVERDNDWTYDFGVRLNQRAIGWRGDIFCADVVVTDGAAQGEDNDFQRGHCEQRFREILWLL